MKGRVRFAILALACVGISSSVAANLWFVTRHVVVQQRNEAARPGFSLLKDGDIVAPLEGHDDNGRPVRVNYTDSEMPTVLYVLSPGCQWCAINAENIKAIAGQTGNRYRIIGVSLSDEGLADHLASVKYPFPVLGGISPETKKAYALGPTPQTIVVDRGGRVLRTWLGAFRDPVVRDEVEKVLDVKLPVTGA